MQCTMALWIIETEMWDHRGSPARVCPGTSRASQLNITACLRIIRLQVGCFQVFRPWSAGPFRWIMMFMILLLQPSFKGNFPLPRYQRVHLFLRTKLGWPTAKLGPLELQATFLKFSGQHQEKITRHWEERWTSEHEHIEVRRTS